MSDAVDGSNRAQRRALRTRQSILGAGQTLLADNEFGAVTVADITNLADVALGSFYNHFDSRDDMIETIVTEAAMSQTRLSTDIVDSVGADGCGTLVGFSVAWIHRAALDRQWARIVHHAIAVKRWPPGNRLSIAPQAVAQALATTSSTINVSTAAEMIKAIHHTVLGPNMGPQLRNVPGAVRDIIGSILRIIEAPASDVARWVDIACDIPVDLSSLDD
jgi:AcrR family transcriptional regulator